MQIKQHAPEIATEKYAEMMAVGEFVEIVLPVSPAIILLGTVLIVRQVQLRCLG